MSPSRRLLASFVAVCIGHAGVLQSVHAADLVSAEQVAQQQGLLAPAHDARAQLLALFDRQDVVDALAARGVPPAEARARVAALGDAEAAQLLAGIDTSPAGASELIGTLVLIAVLIVFSDILGFTRILPFLHPAR